MINRLKTHEFHMVINNSLRLKLKNISLLLNLNLSKTLIYILENLTAIFDKMHLLYKEENSAPEIVNWDSHIHIYFPDSKKYIYNKLKSIHKDNNTYSIACKLRYLLKVFIRGVEMYGLEKFLKILKSAKDKWENKKIKIKVWYKKEKVRQLSLSPYINTLYCKNYTVILIKLLN
jgi:hypothetical protein